MGCGFLYARCSNENGPFDPGATPAARRGGRITFLRHKSFSTICKRSFHGAQEKAFATGSRSFCRINYFRDQSCEVRGIQSANSRRILICSHYLSAQFPMDRCVYHANFPKGVNYESTLRAYAERLCRFTMAPGSQF